MEKRKGGIYAQWFEIVGFKNGRKTTFIIYRSQASNYAQAVRFFNETWGHLKMKCLTLRNAEPYNMDNLMFA